MVESVTAGRVRGTSVPVAPAWEACGVEDQVEARDPAWVMAGWAPARREKSRCDAVDELGF
jgi:hypothetical protein